MISLRAGLINNPEGEVVLNGSKARFEAFKFPQMKPGDILSTGEGRVEVLLNPGSFVRLWESSSLRLVSDALAHPSYEVLSGSSVLEMASDEKNIPVDIAWKEVTVSPLKRGVFRLDADPPVLRVFDGEALVKAAGRQVKVGKGKMLSLDGTWAIASFDRKQTNELDRWSAKRAACLAMVNMQTAYGAADRRGSGGLWGWSSQFEIITYTPYAGIYRSFYGCRFYSARSLAAYNSPNGAAFLVLRKWGEQFQLRPVLRDECRDLGRRLGHHRGEQSGVHHPEQCFDRAHFPGFRQCGREGSLAQYCSLNEISVLLCFEQEAQRARTIAELPPGARITDYISLGVLTKTFPLTKFQSVLAASARGSIRQRDLPAHVVVYYVIALALYMRPHQTRMGTTAADEKGNAEAFGRPGVSRGASAYPQIRFVSLVENGTHVLFGGQMADCSTGEITLAKQVLPALREGTLRLGDRNFFGFALWNQARATSTGHFTDAVLQAL